MFNKINPKPNFPELETEIIEYWKKNKIFKKQVEQRPENNKYVFYDGPPFITGLPHYGHLLGSISKDIIPRYHAMKGKRVDRVWGWDCHGLPIENKVEKKLGLKNRREIEALGIDKFVKECYGYTREVSSEWDWYVDRIGRWADMDRAYKTMDQTYMESVMWVFKQLYEKELIYEGKRTSLFCTRCGTPISNFEIAMDNSYKDMEDPGITVKFKLHNYKNETPGIPVYMLAWTTTPWTVPSNRGLVVEATGDYMRIRRKITHKTRKGATAFVYNPKKDEFMTLVWNKDKPLGIHSLIQGGQEENETLEETIKREITEETGFLNVKIVKKLGTNKYQGQDNLNSLMSKEYDMYLVELENGNTTKITEPKKSEYEVVWTKSEDFYKNLTYTSHIKFAELVQKHYKGEQFDGLNYVENFVSDSDYSEDLILGKDRLKDMVKDMEYEVIEEMKGESLVGYSYTPPFDFFPPNEKDFKTYAYTGMVSADEGVGIVHSAPGFGEVDTEMGKDNGLTLMMTVDDEGKFISTAGKFAGMFYKSANKFIVEDLKNRNLIFDYDAIVHRFPFCYRCETPLIQKAQNSWFINVQKIKSDLIDNNEKINWVPSHIKYGRFKKGLETAPDWCVSRSRYWGTPMPIWESKDTDGQIIERIVVGSRDDIKNRSTEVTKIILVRHGDYNENEINPSLNEKGNIQSEKLVTLLENEKIDVILSSSMLRCVETIHPLATKKAIEIKVDERFGSLDRKLKLREKKKNAGVDLIEELEEQKALELLADSIEIDKSTLASIYEEYKGKTIVISTHAEIISSIRYILEGGKITSYFKSLIPNGEKFDTYMYKGKLLDLHRPVIDDVELRGDISDVPLKRVSDTLDVWMESASMPYAMWHYPFENKDDVESNFPADYISEYIAQTRAWFYVMHVISTALMGTNSFRNVVVSGVIMGNDGRKMSKSFGNYPDPKGVLESLGGDALRMYLLRTPLLKAENVDINEGEIRGQVRDFLLPLWNTYSFFLTYAEIHNWRPRESLVNNERTVENESHKMLAWDHIPFDKLENRLDSWIVTKLQQTIRNVIIKLDEYDIPGATKELPDFMSYLSKWYVRRSRDRFRNGDNAALDTLFYVLVEYSKLIAPFTPFISESIYRNLVPTWSEFSDQPESVHLCDYPHEDMKYLEEHTRMMMEMDSVMIVSTLGQSLRAEKGLKVRQPLSKIYVSLNRNAGDDKELTDWMKEIICEELNIKEVVEMANPNSHMKGDNFFISEDAKNNLKITVDANMSKELIEEGMYREIVRNIQSLRKKSGLKLGEEVEIKLMSEDADLKATFDKFLIALTKDINASKLTWDVNDGEKIKVNGKELSVKFY